MGQHLGRGGVRAPRDAAARPTGSTSPLLLRGDGRKFGKTEGGNENVWLDADLTSPFAMHQFLLNSDDEITPKLLRWFTFLDHDEIRELDAALATSPQERRAQRAVATAVVTTVHGEDAAAPGRARQRRPLQRGDRRPRRGDPARGRRRRAVVDGDAR